MATTAATIATDLACALDPALLAERAGISPDPWQADILRSDSPQILLNCHRQSGKSTVVALLADHTAVYEPGELILLLSPSLRQSRELFRKCVDYYRALGEPIPLEIDNRLEFELRSGSRIVSLPGKEGTVRGFSGPRLLIVDEAAKVSDELYYAIRPMLAVSGGRIILLSTPFGKRGFFFKEWDEGEAWERVCVTADRCPRISKEWLEEERRRIGDWWYRQEYLCEFVEALDQVFSYDDIRRALSDESVTPLFG